MFYWKIHAKFKPNYSAYPGPEWCIFLIPTSEDIDDITLYLIYYVYINRRECFTGKYTQNSNQTTVHIQDPSGVFSLSPLVRILMISFPTFSQLFVQTVGKKWQAIELSILVTVIQHVENITW